jgi:DNA-binding transcriptional LysR family regulator
MPSPAIPLLDLSLLQTLVAVQNSGSLAKAAVLVNRTQSAVSVQLQRLEQSLAVDLFDRSGRALVLTDAGQALLGHAQQLLALNHQAVAAVRGHQVAGRVRLGLSVDFEHTALPRALALFAQAHPKIVLDLLVDRNTALQAAVLARELDLALVFGAPAVGGAANLAGAKPSFGPNANKSVVATLPMRWLAAQGWAPQPQQALPLLMLHTPCMFRGAAVAALDAAGLPWRVAVTSQSLAGLWAAAQAGMGVTARSGGLVPAGLVDVGGSLGLPALPPVAVQLLQAPGKASAPRATLSRALHGMAAGLVQAAVR